METESPLLNLGNIVRPLQFKSPKVSGETVNLTLSALVVIPKIQYTFNITHISD